MNLDLKKWVKDEELKKWFRRDNFVVLVLAGILLFIIALPVKEKKGEEDDQGKSAAGQDPLPRETIAAAEESGTDSRIPWIAGADEDYAVYLEKRLTDALSQMADVGKVKVMITLKVSGELVLEKDFSTSQSTTDESDAQGGSRSISEMTSEGKTVYSTDGAYSEPYVVKVCAPKIEGVLVVAEGAGRGTVNRTIAEIAQALFGVEAHKVIVVKMDS